LLHSSVNTLMPLNSTLRYSKNGKYCYVFPIILKMAKCCFKCFPGFNCVTSTSSLAAVLEFRISYKIGFIGNRMYHILLPC
jgi:hypothetical protein